jgi:Ca2+-binding RTX toxin-like protein
LFAALLPGSPANAGTNCTYSESTGELTYLLGGAADSDDGVLFFRNPEDDSIEPYSTLDREDRVGCLGEPTVFNVDKIIVDGFGDPSSIFRVGIDLSGGPFAPGRTNESGPTDEIEFEFSVDSVDPNNELRILGGTSADRLAFGGSGINLNAQERTGVDSDVDFAPEAFSMFRVVGGFGNDVVDASGAAGTGGRWNAPMTFFMGDGKDIFRYGRSIENLILGSRGIDLLDFSAAPQGVEVDLTVDDFQYEGEFHGIENLIGSGDGDILKGDAKANIIKSGAGSDVLEGDAGADLLDGEAGYDYCTSGPGADTLLHCEE